MANVALEHVSKSYGNLEVIEDLNLTIDDGGDAQLPVTVDVVENLGGTRYLYGVTASGEAMVVEVRDRHGIKSDDIVPVGLRADRSLVFRSSGERLRQGN